MAGYQIKGYSKRASEFVTRHAQVIAPHGQIVYKLPLIVTGVWIHIVEMNGELKVMMEMGENTTHDELREAVVLASAGDEIGYVHSREIVVQPRQEE